VVDGLLLETQRRLELLYAVPAQPPVTDFVIPEAESSAYPGQGSRTLVTVSGEDLSVGVVLDSGVGESLRGADPRRRLDERNLGAFCTLTEEVSHFVYVLFRAAVGRPVTELELELQGDVDKYLGVVFLLSLQNEGAVSRSVREALFRRYRLAEGLSRERAERYRAASRLADRYCGFLERAFLAPARLQDLCREARRFYRLGQREKLERIARLD
jgi:hypothetical protein